MKIIIETQNGGGHIQIEGTLDLCSQVTPHIFQGLINHEINEIEKPKQKNIITKDFTDKIKKVPRKDYVKVTEKHCPKCDKTKPVKDFNKSSHERTGYQSYCRDCSNKRSVEYNEKPTKYKDKFNFVEPEKQPAINPEKQPDTPVLKSTETVFQWTPAKDKILRSNFKELGVSGIYDKSLLPGFSLAEIRRRCQELKLIDQYGINVSR